MKKYLATLCAAMLCVCCLALAACGGSSSSSAAASSAASGSAAASSATASSAAASSAAASSSAAADPASALPGDWKVAAAEMQGITMSGDFSALAGDSVNIAMSFNADGTGKMTMQDEFVDMTWKLDGNNIDMTVEDRTMTAVYEDGAIKLSGTDAESFDGTIIFTKDGTYPAAKVITAEGAKPIASADAIAGDWKLVGMNLMGISMYGDAETLSTMMGEGDYATSFKADGTATIMGDNGTFDAATSTVTLSNDAKAPIGTIDDQLVIDMSELLGTPLILVYEK